MARLRAIFFTIAILIGIFASAGCMVDDDTTTGNVLPPNTPQVPIPSYAGEVLPVTSEILVYEEASVSTFSPELDTVPEPFLSTYDFGFGVIYNPHPYRCLMVENGVKVNPVLLDIKACTDAGCDGGAYISDLEGPALAEIPKIQWIRYWKKLISVTVPYPTTYQQSHTYTEGTSETTGESFTLSLGVSASGWGVGLSAELSQTFTHEVTVSSETSITKTFTCNSVPGKIIQFTVWQLVEGFRFRNSDYTAFTDPVYDFYQLPEIGNETDQLYMSVVEFDE
ncbi:MAG: hypothetical protein JSV25_08755 [Spirochaetota bacterium]|nr:MAG: hypothetical protein JSV25_08755 [Spirochaetota bacterium]